MRKLFVVVNPSKWPLEIPGVEVIAARDYLTDPTYSGMQSARVFNLSRSYRYMSTGYYVSLLAEARGHRVMPTVGTVRDLRSESVFKVVSEEVDSLIQKSLASLKRNEFVLSVYFGKGVDKKYSRLAAALFGLFEAPLLRATFSRGERWRLDQMMLIGVLDVPEKHKPVIVDAAQAYFKRGSARRAPKRYQYDLAILHNPEEREPPSDEKALARFCRAAEKLGFYPELITRTDYRRLAEYDALFIRETTYVDHHTFRFASKAAAEGMPVIDDPQSIIRCTNKVYLAELFDRHKLPQPRTLIVHQNNTGEVADTLGLPCILKRPDSSFSQGVIKVETPDALAKELSVMLDASDLVIAQEFLPTDFDWRVGVLDNRVLYVCKYYMAPQHWQILKKDSSGSLQGGRVETIDVAVAPTRLLSLARKACRQIGDGFYGVDIKQSGKKFFVMEINDNPSVDAGYEDKVLKEELYLTVMRTLLKRVEKTKEARRTK